MYCLLSRNGIACSDPVQIMDVFMLFMYPFCSVYRGITKGLIMCPNAHKRVSENRETRGLGLHWSVSVIEIGAGIDELILSGLFNITLKVVPIKRKMEQTSLRQV